MPTLSAITATFFVDLITRLGVRPPPPDAFVLSNVVQPVSIVDSGITFSAVSSSQLLDTPFTNGVVVAPAIGAVLADTGAQPAGNYAAFLMIEGFDSIVNPNMSLQRRNAANGASIWDQALYEVGGANARPFKRFYSLRLVLALNERLRVVSNIAGGAAMNYQVSIWLVPTT